jgi:hypothetical protein
MAASALGTFLRVDELVARVGSAGVAGPVFLRADSGSGAWRRLLRTACRPAKSRWVDREAGTLLDVDGARVVRCAGQRRSRGRRSRNPIGAPPETVAMYGAYVDARSHDPRMVHRSPKGALNA